MKKMLSLILTAAVLLTAVCTGGFSASAATKVSGNFTYFINSEGNAVLQKCSGSYYKLVIPGEVDGIKVTGIADNVFAGESDNPNKTLKSVEIPDSVTVIGEAVFKYCTKLKKVKLGASVKDIGRYAFYGCKNLRDINFPESLKAIGDYSFSGCKKIESVCFPDGFTSIGTDAFYECKALKNVSLPDSVENIGDGAFAWSALEKFKLPPKLTVIPNTLLIYTNITEFEIPEGVTEIGGWALCGTKISSVKIPSSVTKIGSEAFSCCYELEECIIPETVKMMGENHVFSNCSKLKKLIIKAPVEEIGYYFCNECTSLETVQIPDTVKKIGQNAFGACKKLKKLDLPEGLEVLNMSAFEKSGIESVKLGKNVSMVKGLCGARKLKTIILDKNNPNFKLKNGVLYTKAGKRLVLYPAGKSGKSFKVPSTVTGICSGAFYANQKLEEVKLNKGLKKINNWAFKYANIKKLVIPGTVSYIGGHAFANCDKLKSVKFRRNKPTYVWDGAFYECKSLEYAEYPRMKGEDNEYPLCGEYMFDGCVKLKKVKVRDGVTKMQTGAFSDCPGVKEAYIPESVCSIDLYLGNRFDKNYDFKPMKGFVIKGKKNSFAEEYAKENGIKFVAV